MGIEISRCCINPCGFDVEEELTPTNYVHPKQPNPPVTVSTTSDTSRNKKYTGSTAGNIYRPSTKSVVKPITKKKKVKISTMNDLIGICEKKNEEEAINMVKINPFLITELSKKDGNNLLIYVASLHMENLAIKIIKLNSKLSLLEREQNKYDAMHYAKKLDMKSLMKYWKDTRFSKV